uniref:Uncharacterized protein n=1 Tax=Octopus bimaculoides TaxID=37653 RepID=A0A0L8FPC2_OCTBM
MIQPLYRSFSFVYATCFQDCNFEICSSDAGCSSPKRVKLSLADILFIRRSDLEERMKHLWDRVPIHFTALLNCEGKSKLFSFWTTSATVIQKNIIPGMVALAEPYILESVRNVFLWLLVDVLLQPHISPFH